MKQLKSTNPIIGTGLKTLSRIKDGEGGYSLNLSNDSHVIPVDGELENYIGCETTVGLYIGSNLIASNVSYVIEPSSEVEGYWNESLRTYTITKVTAQVGSVKIIANYGEVSLERVFTASKIENGEDSILVTLTNDSHVFPSNAFGYISQEFATETQIKMYRGVNEVQPDSISIPTNNPPGLRITKTNGLINIVATVGSSLAIAGYFNITAMLGGKRFDKTFSWTKTKDGQDGQDGPQGLPGPPGKDAQTKYTWVKYAKDSNGTDMADLPSTERKYIGLAYNKDTATESLNPVDYQWSKYSGDQGIPGQPGIDGKTYYTWIKYAFDETGSGISDDPTGREYLGISYNNLIQEESMNPTYYTWTKIHGDQGMPGKPGTDGITYYTWIKYSNSSDGSNMTDNPAGMEYIGFAYNKTTQAESTNKTDYAWSKIKGEEGSQGIPGIPGPPGETLYTWIKYADDENGNGMSNFPEGKGYIGIAYNKPTVNESTNAIDYSWSKYMGDQGIPGLPGDDGESLYTWIKYADTPTTGMSDNPSGKEYMGIAYNKTTPTESTNYNDYSWSLVLGPTGPQGPVGPVGPQGPEGPVLDWIKDWESQSGTLVDQYKILTPKLFAGTVTSGIPTGIAIGKNVLGTTGTYANVTGIAGYNNGVKTFHIKADGSAVFGKDTESQLTIATNGTISIPAAKITGKLTANQIDATNLYVSSANISGTIQANQINGNGLYVSGAATITGTISANKLVGGTIEGININGSTITGGNINLEGGIFRFNGGATMQGFSVADLTVSCAYSTWETYRLTVEGDLTVTGKTNLTGVVAVFG